MIQELASCADATGNALISITETDDEVLMKGTFFVVLVSPYRFDLECIVIRRTHFNDDPSSMMMTALWIPGITGHLHWYSKTSKSL